VVAGMLASLLGLGFAFLYVNNFGRTYESSGVTLKSVTIKGEKYSRGYTGEMRWGRPNGEGNMAFTNDKDDSDWFILYGEFKNGSPVGEGTIDNYSSIDPFKRHIVLNGSWDCKDWIPSPEKDITVTYDNGATSVVSYDNDGNMNGNLPLPYPGTGIDSVTYSINHGVVVDEAVIGVMDAFAGVYRDYTIGINTDTGLIAPSTAIDEAVYTIISNSDNAKFDVDGINTIKNALSDNDIIGNNSIVDLSPFNGIRVIDANGENSSDPKVWSGAIVVSSIYGGALRDKAEFISYFENHMVYSDPYTSYGNFDICDLSTYYAVFVGDKHIDNLRDYQNVYDTTLLTNFIVLGYMNDKPVYLFTYFGSGSAEQYGGGAKADGFGEE
jgi:hypothetical protein